MATGILHLHSYFAYLVLISLIIGIVYFLTKGKKVLTSGDKKFALIPLIFTHLQVVFGLLLYILEGRYKGLSEMGNSAIRYFALEHPFINILGVILITMGYSKIKKKIAVGGYNGSEWLFFLGGLILLLSRIPFNAWLN